MKEKFNSITVGEDDYNIYTLMTRHPIGVNKKLSKALPAFPRFQFTTLAKDPRPRCYLPPNFGFSLKTYRILKFNNGKLRMRKPTVII